MVNAKFMEFAKAGLPIPILKGIEVTGKKDKKGDALYTVTRSWINDQVKQNVDRRTDMIQANADARYKEHVSKMYTTIYTVLYYTLHEKFGFGKERLHRLRDMTEEFYDSLVELDEYGQPYVRFTDIAKEINKMGFEFDLNHAKSMDRSANEVMNIGKPKMTPQSVYNWLRGHEYPEAAAEFKDFWGEEHVSDEA